jgi:nucleotide-binding universal stress UspA family protein
MNEQPNSQGIVVGLDGSEDSRLALRWALVAAQSSGRPVHLVHCHHVVKGAADKGLAAWGSRLLEAGLGLCHEFPDVRATAELVDTRDQSPAAGLLAASEAVDMLVIGCRGHRSPLGVVWGSVSEHLSRHAICPVVTVRPPNDASATRVVLGLTVPEPTEGAIAYAFEYASHHGVGLTAINVWHEHAPSSAAEFYPLEHDIALEPDRHLGSLNDVLEPWLSKFPDVMVTAESIGGHAASVLRYASEHAALLVVGRPERGGVSRLLGSISQSMLHHAQCPVAVVGLSTSAVRLPAPALAPHPVSDF